MQDYLQRIIRQSKSDYCEIRIEETQATHINFQGLKMEQLKQSLIWGGSIRVLIDGGWGFISFNNLDNPERKLRQAEEQARMVARHKKEPTKIASLTSVVDQVHTNFKEDPRKVPLPEKVELLEHYNNLILKCDQRITSSRIIYFDKHTHWHFANSEGSYIYQEKTDLGGHLGASAANANENTYDSVSFGSTNDFGVARNLDDRVMETAKRAVALLSAPTVKGGKYSVILDPELAGLFVHEAFGHLSEADEIYDDENLRRLMATGNRYGSALLNIYDSGCELGHRGSYKYDDEGVLTEKTYLIKEGLVVGHLHSRESAAKMGTKPTGNARALDYRFPPICRMRTTCIEGGTATFQEMLADIDLGIYAAGGYGGQTNGELFTFAASWGYMIRNGQLAELVKNVSLSGNVFHTLDNIDMIGNDFIILNNAGGCGKWEQSPLATSEGSPHIRIRNIIIGGEK